MADVPSTDVLESCARRVEGGVRTTVEGILIAGEALAQARQHFGNDNNAFGAWREQRLPWLKRDTALNFMQVWQRFGAGLRNNSATPDLPVSVLYALAAPSTDDAVVAQAVEKAENGEKVTVADVRRWKSLADLYKTESEEAQRRNTALSNQITTIRARHGDELKDARAKAKAAEDARRALKRQVKDLEARKPETVTERVEVIPEGFASLDAALADRRDKLAAAERALAEAERGAAEADRQQADKLAALDTGDRIAAFKDDIVAVLARHQDVEAALHQGAPEAYAAVVEALEHRLTDLVALCRKARTPTKETPA